MRHLAPREMLDAVFLCAALEGAKPLALEAAASEPAIAKKAYICRHDTGVDLAGDSPSKPAWLESSAGQEGWKYSIDPSGGASVAVF